MPPSAHSPRKQSLQPFQTRKLFQNTPGCAEKASKHNVRWGHSNTTVFVTRVAVAFWRAQTFQTLQSCLAGQTLEVLRAHIEISKIKIIGIFFPNFVRIKYFAQLLNDRTLTKTNTAPACPDLNLLRNSRGLFPGKSCPQKIHSLWF